MRVNAHSFDFLAHAEVAQLPQVWTYKQRVAFVLSVTENGMPVQDGVKLQRLQELLFTMMDSEGNGIVAIKRVRSVVIPLHLSLWVLYL